jgi:hypothetical protein
MQNAARILIVAAGAAALIGCDKQQPKAAANDDLSIEANVANGRVPPGAEIETLPADESSDASNGELAAGAADQAESNADGNAPQPH